MRINRQIDRTVLMLMLMSHFMRGYCQDCVKLKNLQVFAERMANGSAAEWTILLSIYITHVVQCF